MARNPFLSPLYPKRKRRRITVKVDGVVWGKGPLVCYDTLTKARQGVMWEWRRANPGKINPVVIATYTDPDRVFKPKAFLRNFTTTKKTNPLDKLFK